MKHYKTSFKGEKPLDQIHAAVGRDGSLVTRVDVARGETHVYFHGEGGGKHLREALGAGDVTEVREEDVRKAG
jgi:hypothetical protein